MVGPMIIPMPNDVSSMANMVATLDGNSLAIMLKLPVRKPELPQASTILFEHKILLQRFDQENITFFMQTNGYLRVKERAKNIFPFSILSKSPKRIDVTPTVPIPMVNVA